MPRMTLQELQPYWLPAAMAGYFALRILRARSIKAKLPQLIKDNALVVDVRSPGEFASAASSGSINIPLPELPKRLNELDRTRPIILCCASGARSGVAVRILKKAGFEKVNAGPWTNTVS